MRTRGKLNSLYLVGAAALAGYIGLVINSWWAFGVALVALVVINVHAGNIRLSASRR